MSIATAAAPLWADDPRVNELYAEHGFARTDSEGNIVRERAKLVASIADFLVSEALAADADERVQKAVSKPVLYERIFSLGPKMDDPDEAERDVAEYIATHVWSMTTPSSDGRIQLALGDRSGTKDLMLCRRKIGGVPSIYVTRTDELIVDDYVIPASEKVIKVADKTRRDMALAVKRRPSLEARINGELADLALKTSVALGVTSMPALGSGS